MVNFFKERLLSKIMKCDLQFVNSRFFCKIEVSESTVNRDNYGSNRFFFFFFVFATVVNYSKIFTGSMFGEKCALYWTKSVKLCHFTKKSERN